ncbi:hypothetical protein TUM4438_46080 [Shewanella sairae]|uniref:Uncharacterized protein n=1 Tax=Shewanella sairae TaxID=190310 RepID=A0ABQ4PRY4_9GAMM|nr:hypothetical protein [Shewanella sairae]MCL1132732.1 hypothetical protein [Shewanella sairae]GIU52719.1 hypothetical protein TUM4438_46080 [Shewanella sairae]
MIAYARQAEIELEKIQFEKDVKVYLKEFSDMPITEFYTMRRECGFSFSRTAKCKAFLDISESKISTELDRLIGEYKKDELIVYSKKMCKGISYDEVKCELSRKSIDKQEQKQVDYYLTNRDVLISVFNTCQSNYAELRKGRKYTEAQKAIETFDCKHAAKAAQKLKVYGFSNPIG